MYVYIFVSCAYSPPSLPSHILPLLSSWSLWPTLQIVLFFLSERARTHACAHIHTPRFCIWEKTCDILFLHYPGFSHLPLCPDLFLLPPIVKFTFHMWKEKLYLLSWMWLLLSRMIIFQASFLYSWHGFGLLHDCIRVHCSCMSSLHLW